MAETTRPLPDIPPDMTPQEVPQRLPDILRKLGNWVAQEIKFLRDRILSDPRLSDDRVAKGLRSRAIEYSLEKMNRGQPGDVLVILPDGRCVDWANASTISPSGGSPSGLNHNILSATHTDSLTGTVVRGDLIVGNSTPAWARFAKGASGTILQMGANDPAWTAKATAISHTILDGSVHTDSVAQGATKGSLICGNATPKWDELVVGSDGQVLTADSAQTLGVKWAAAAASTHALMDSSVITDVVNNSPTRGSLIYGNSTPKWDELTIGAAGKVLYTDGTDASWASTLAEELTFNKSMIHKAIVHAQQTPTPARPSADYVKLFAAESEAGSRVNLAQWRAAGRMQWLQGLLGHNGCSVIVPGTSTTPVVFNTALTNTGTVSHPSPATTNYSTHLRRILITSGVGGSQSATMVESQIHTTIGNAAGRGGFYYCARLFGAWDTSLGHYFFAGLRASTTGPTTTTPSNMVSFVGIGMEPGTPDDTNFFFMHNDSSGTATKSDSGIAYTGTTVVQLEMYCDPNTSTIYFWLTRLDDTTVATATYNTSSNIPANTAFMGMQFHANTGTEGDTGPVTVNVVRAYSECDV